MGQTRDIRKLKNMHTLRVSPTLEKDIWVSLMKKSHTSTENKKEKWYKEQKATKLFDYTTIADRLRETVGVTTAIKLLWLNRLTGSQHSHWPQKMCNQKATHLKNVNNPSYEYRGPTTNKRGEVIKISTQTSKVIKILYQKHIKTSTRIAMRLHNDCEPT